MTGFIPYTKIAGLGLSNIGTIFNMDEASENAPGGFWGTALTASANKQYMSSEDRANYDRNWLEQFGDSMRGDGQEVQTERAMGDIFSGEGTQNSQMWRRQNVNRDEDRSGWAQGLGNVASKIPWGSVFGG